MTKFEITFQPEGKRVSVPHNTTLLEAAQLAGVDLTTICAGKGTCGKCKIQVNDDSFDQLATKSEEKYLTKEEINAGFRLACQTRVNKKLVIRIPEKSRTGKQRLQIEGIKTHVPLSPLVKKYYVQLSKPTIEDSCPDLERLIQGLEKDENLSGIDIKFNLLKDLGSLLRDAKWKITVTIWNDSQIIAIEPGDTTKRLFGFAIDIGTTKLAGYLLDMNTGEVLSVESAINPQVPFGEDILSRINFICLPQDEADPRELQKVLIQTTNEIIADLCEKSDVRYEEIYEMSVVGNTAMHHIFLNINPRYLSLAPYTPVVRKGINIEPDEIGVKINPTGNIYLLPVIAGYNGADNTAVILATELYKRTELCLVLDIGTNTEVVLGNKDQMLVCSCASGPAFEGASIKHGMRAASGAIERIKIEPETLTCKYDTIDKVPPRGICGSAIVDVMAEMLKTGIMDHTGRMNKSITSQNLRQGPDGFEFILVRAEETSTGDDVVITQKDIRQITLAKAAMHTGTMLLMEELGVSETDIEKVFIAGAFGNYIDVSNARFIGMYPEIALSKVEIVGNAAGTGARMALLSKEIRELAEKIVRDQIRYVELAAKESFQNTYLNSTYIPYADYSKYPETGSTLKKLGLFPDKLPHIF